MQFSDADGDPLTYTYAWFRNGQPIAGDDGEDAAGVHDRRGRHDPRRGARRRRPRRYDRGGATATVNVLEDPKLHQPVAGTVQITPGEPDHERDR